jgi:hypothetical protein
MTIDDAIRQLEELRRLYGGHVPVKYRDSKIDRYGETVERDCEPEIGMEAAGGARQNGRVVRIRAVEF